MNGTRRKAKPNNQQYRKAPPLFHIATETPSSLSDLQAQSKVAFDFRTKKRGGRRRMRSRAAILIATSFQ
jgi:hypothetical protein